MKEINKVRPKIAIALGSGGARGYAHIGFLRAFEEENIPIDIVTGTSMGAIIGGAYAAGLSVDEIEYMAKNVRLLKMFDICLPVKGGFIRGTRANRMFKRLYKNKQAAITFDKTRIPFGCAALDLVSGRVVYQTKGDLISAIRASYSIGGVYRPVRRDGMVLVDGGPLCRVPVRLAREMGADIVVGIDCAGPTVPVSPESFKKYPDTVTRLFLIMEYQASQKEINEADIKVDMYQTDIHPFKFKEGIVTIERGYQEGKKVAAQLKKLLKDYDKKANSPQK